jgi:hypothetical protein
MPRKLRTPKTRRADVLPAVAYWLMTGTHDHPMVAGRHRLPGWFRAFQLCHFERIERGGVAPGHIRGTFGREVEPHVETMTDEAKQYGFAPWCATGKAPQGPAFAAWQAAFLAQHLY